MRLIMKVRLIIKVRLIKKVRLIIKDSIYRKLNIYFYKMNSSVNKSSSKNPLETTKISTLQKSFISMS